MNWVGPRGALAISSVLGLVLAAGSARADDATPAPTDPDAEPLKPPTRTAASGWFAEAGFGATVFLPPTASYAKPGPNLEIRLGRDLVSWFSLALYAAASSHEAIVPPPPEGEWFQVYRGGADARLGGRIGRLALFLEGGAGVALISSNVLDKVGITEPGDTFAAVFHAGAGFEYQLWNRHYAIGTAGDAFLIPQFDTARAVGIRAYLRYTY